MFIRSLVVATCLLFVGCGDTDPEQLPATAVSGTMVAFDLESDLGVPERFYDFPFPSDLRQRSDGTPNLDGFPFPPTNRIIPPILEVARERRGAPITAVSNFRFSGALGVRRVGDVMAPHREAPVLLVDIDEDSPERGRLFPVVASTPAADAYVPQHLLTVAARAGVTVAPNRTYAFVVQRSLGDANGEPLGVPLSIVELSRGQAPAAARGEAAREMLQPLWTTLDRIGVPRRNVAAANVFTTSDVVADLAALSTAVVERFPVELRDVHLRQGEGVYPRFCEINATVRMPQFQTGTPPFNTLGRFVYASDGFPVIQTEQDVPVVITLPRQVMPSDGFPLVLYAHGSGGLARQVVDRGATKDPGGRPQPGEGPAHVLAAHGFASVGVASPLNPERLPGADARVYLNFRNLAAYPDTFRQGLIEIRLLLAALERLRLDVNPLAECMGLQTPPGESAVRLRSQPLYIMGQSLGAQYVTLLAAVEPRVRAVVPTGSGGLLSRVILAVSGEDRPTTLVNSLLGTAAQLTYLHPGLQLVQLGFESVEPIVFAPRIAVDPLPGQPVRSIYQPVGLDDPGFPNQIYDAMALAYGTQQAGEVLWPGLQAALATLGSDGILPYPVEGNGTAVDGRAYTGVVAQYAADGILDAHHIAAQLDAVKYQYGCFLKSMEGGGVGRVPAPASLSESCPAE